jgi:hypothetical protein
MNASPARLIRPLFQPLIRTSLTAWCAALCLCACAPLHARTAPRELFAAIRLGMSRAEVEKLLGAPTAPSTPPDQGIWYLPPPILEPYESPFAPGTIGLTYSPGSRVTAKVLNPQLRD